MGEDRVEVAETKKFSCLGLPRVTVLASSGDETFVEDRRGNRRWVPSRDVVADAEDSWSLICGRVDVKVVEPSDVALDAVRSALAVPSRPLCNPRAIEVVPGVWHYKDALAADELAEMHMCAESCLVDRWGTVRRRTVGEPTERRRSPTMTHVRLTSQVTSRAPRALATLRTLAVRHGRPTLDFKQCDYLVYGPGDGAGWHDHAGESELFLVALLFKDEACLGGDFEIRGFPAGELLRDPGDVLICPSRTDHRVASLRSGHRISVNVDFWDLRGAPDRRSRYDLI